MKKILSLLLAVALTFSCFAGLTPETVSAAAEQRLNFQTRYGYSFPAPENVSGDEEGVLLTDGRTDVYSFVTVQNKTKTFNAKGKQPLTVDLFLKGKDPHFYIQNDFGFVSDVTGVTVQFGTVDGAVLPANAEVFITNDGYNYVQYPEQTLVKNGGSYEIRFDQSVKAKGVKLMVYTALDQKIAVSELSVFGTAGPNQRVLLSQGASYNWEGGPIPGFGEDREGRLLTDGHVAKPDEKSAMVSRNSLTDGKDPVSTSGASLLDVDLGRVCQVSEVELTAHTACSPDYVTVKYSADGKTYYDLGQSSRMGQFGSGSRMCTQYAVLRNHTVKARYLKISLVGKQAVLSELSVYGCQNPVAEMDYGFRAGNKLSEYTNIAPDAAVKKNNWNNNRLNDEDYVTAESFSLRKNNTVTMDFPDARDMDGVMLYFLEGGSDKLPKNVKTFVSSDGSSFTEIKAPVTVHHMAGRATYRQYFHSEKIRKIKFEMQANTLADTIGLLEIGVYSGQPQLPIYRGGFFQINCLDYNFEHAVIKNTEQMWYLQLKGMKELGMEEVILTASASFVEKRVCFPSPTLLGKGYQMTYGLGCKDPYKAILEAAEKLGMKVYIGTVTTYGSMPAIVEHGGLAHVKEVLADDHAVMQDIAQLYGRYSSFAGFYFPNETCDQWLNEKDGPTIYRTLYVTQGKWVRELTPGKKSIIAPAVWAVGQPATNRNLIYELVKPETAGGLPAVDIVAPQDCLGRDPNLEVSNERFLNFERHIQEWAKGVRQAGAEFWCDAEVFEQNYYPKRYTDDIHGLELESKMTNHIVNFDIPHYFAEISQGGLSTWKRFDMSATLSSYAKRYARQYRALDQVGRNPQPIPPVEMEKIPYDLGDLRSAPGVLPMNGGLLYTDDMNPGFAQLTDRSANTQAEHNPKLNTGLYGKTGSDALQPAWFTWEVGPNIERVKLHVQCLAGFGRPEEIKVEVSHNGVQWTNVPLRHTEPVADGQIYGPQDPVDWLYSDVVSADSILPGNRFLRVTLLPYTAKAAPVWSLELDQLEVEYQGSAALRVTAPPVRTEYPTGTAVPDLKGGELTLSFESGTVRTIPLADAQIIGFDGQKPGRQTLTALYAGETASFDVLVFPAEAEAMHAKTEQFYTTLEQALTESPDGSELRLLKDVNKNELMVHQQRILDLNGHCLRAQYLAVFKGSQVTDSGKTGLLAVPQGNLVIPAEQPALPIWNGKDGYLLKTPDLGKKCNLDLSYHQGTGMKLLFKPVFGERELETALFADGCRDNDVQIQVELVWKNSVGSDVSQKFVFIESFVQAVYGAPNKGFSLSAADIGKCSDLRIFIVVESGTGVRVSKEVRA